MVTEVDTFFEMTGRGRSKFVIINLFDSSKQ
jgi:hypothetical protein